MNLSVSTRDSDPGRETSVLLSNTSQTKRRKYFVLTIVFLWLIVYASTIFTPPLLDDADTVHAEAAREMVLRHDWVTLYANGVRYLEKAPLMYWGVAASYRLFGVSDWSTRLTLLFGVLAWLFATYWIGRRVYGEAGGFDASLVLATAVGPYMYTRFLIPDVLVGLWLTVGFGFFLQTLEEERPSRTACWGFAICTGLNVITKGLIGLVFPIGTLGIYLLLTGSLKHLLRLRIFSSLAVFLAVAAPWHVLAALRNPDQGSVRGFLWFYFVNEHVLRFLNRRMPRDYDTVPLILFWMLTLVWLVPWTAFLPQAFRDVLGTWRAWRSNLSMQQKAGLLFAVWGLLILCFFSFSTRQEYYTIPALPAFALLIGNCLAREEGSSAESRVRRASQISSSVLFAIGVLGFLTGMTFLFYSKAPRAGTDLADLLKKNPQ